MAHWSLWKNLLKSSSYFFVRKKHTGNFFTSPISVQLSQYFHCSLSQINLFIYIIMIKIYFEAKLSEWKHPQYLAQMILKIIFMNYWKNVGSKIVWRKRIKIEIIFNFARFLIVDFFLIFHVKFQIWRKKRIKFKILKRRLYEPKFCVPLKVTVLLVSDAITIFQLTKKLRLALFPNFYSEKTWTWHYPFFFQLVGRVTRKKRFI